MQLSGIHHLTAVSADASGNVRVMELLPCFSRSVGKSKKVMSLPGSGAAAFP